MCIAIYLFQEEYISIMKFFEAQQAPTLLEQLTPRFYALCISSWAHITFGKDYEQATINKMGKTFGEVLNSMCGVVWWFLIPACMEELGVKSAAF